MTDPPEGPDERLARLAKLLSHPVRVQILSLLAEGPASPSQLAERLGKPLGGVAYHVKALRSNGLLELHRTEQRRGALMHVYSLGEPMLGAVAGFRASAAAIPASPGNTHAEC